LYKGDTVEDTIVESYEHAGCVIEIIWDPDISDPREMDNLGIMLCAHRRYTLGDEQVEADSRFSECGSWAEIRQVIEADGGTHLKPLWLLDHSGLAMSTGSFGCDPGGWDSGVVGVIYTTKERIDLIGTPEDSIDECLDAEVKEYDDYLQGHGFGYVVTRDGHQIDSCWGYLGYDSIPDAKKEAEFIAEHEEASSVKLGFYEAAH
jgi:hypothetical protein